MNKWVKLLLTGIALGILSGVMNVLGIMRSGVGDTFTYLSFAAGVVATILFWVGLIGFFVTRTRVPKT